MSRPFLAIIVASSLVVVRGADAQPTAAAESPAPTITVGGYLEAYYQLHLQDPSNRITNLRGFDNRSRTFTLSNAVVDVRGEKGPVAARVMLQVGSTPSTYYLAEPAVPGTGGVNPTSGDLWKHLQTAMVTLKAPRDVTVEVGLFTSPVGLEVVPVKDNWNQSRSNLFFGLPFYHTGVHVYRPLGGGWTGKLHVYDGWNSVVDNNPYPTVGVSAAYASSKTTAQILYLGGVERADGAAEGKAWRHLADVLVQHAVTDEVSVAAQLDAGLEANDIGTSSWVAAALYGKVALSDHLYGAVRGDYFHETVAADGSATAGAIFWPTEWMASATATLAYQPTDGVSVRLEVRHDQAASDVFFGGTVTGDGVTTPFVFNRDYQDTATLGVTAWF